MLRPLQLFVALMVLLTLSTFTLAQQKTITIWWAKWAPADGLQELGDEFTKETGTKVIVHQIPWTDFQTQVFTEFGSNTTAFDIVVGDSQWIGRGATKGLYVDLTDWLPSAVDLKSYHPNVLKYLCQYPPGQEKYFAAPLETDAVGFAYRKDWFEDPKEKEAFKVRYHHDLTTPVTWSELKDIAEFFNRPDQKRYGIALLTGRGYDSLTMGFQQVMYAYGGSWSDESGKKINGYVNNDGAVKALDFYKSLLAYAPQGATNFEYNQALEAFTNGSTAMSMNYFAFAPGIVDAMKDKVGFFIIPRKEDKRVISLGGQGMSISAKVSKDQQALAKQFIAWICKEDIQKKWVTKPAGFTGHLAVLKSEAFRNAQVYNAPLADSMDSMVDFWNIPCYNELLSATQESIGQALDGSKTSKEALDDLAKKQEQILEDQ